MRGRGKDKRKYYALTLGVLIVALLAGGTMLQATYGLEGDWSLEMSINSMMVNTQDVWPGDAIRVVGDAESGYDTVMLSVDDLEPINPYGEIVDRSETGTPAIGVSLGSFTQPVPVIDSTSTPGSKIYTWSFVGYISVQTFAAIMVVDNYTIDYATETAITNEVAELNTITLDIDVDFNIIAGEDAVGTCVISDVSVTSTQDMIDYYGVSAEYEYSDAASLKVPVVNTLEATANRPSTGHADVTIVGNIASGAEIFEGDMEVYNAVSTYEVSFEVVQVVGELDTARFSVPTVLNFLPTSADAIIEDPTVFYWVAIIVGIILVVFVSASFLYGKPKK